MVSTIEKWRRDWAVAVLRRSHSRAVMWDPRRVRDCCSALAARRRSDCSTRRECSATCCESRRDNGRDRRCSRAGERLRDRMAREKLRDASRHGFRTLQVQEMSGPLDPELLDLRKPGTEKLMALREESMRVRAQYRQDGRRNGRRLYR